jgi:plasmid stability protein
MAELRIRNVEDWVVEQHRFNARKKGITLGDELKRVLVETAMAQRGKMANEITKNLEKMRNKYGTFPSSVKDIREYRESI